MPVSAHDVAKYILSRTSPVTPMKLQKLLYYCQAWSLVWDEAPLFREKIQALAMGPVVREIYDLHKGAYRLDRWTAGKVSNLSREQRETIDAVLGFYGAKSGQWLSDLTHSEEPWRAARQGLGAWDRSNREISLASMEEYYSSLPPSAEG